MYNQVTAKMVASSETAAAIGAGRLVAPLHHWARARLQLGRWRDAARLGRRHTLRGRPPAASDRGRIAGLAAHLPLHVRAGANKPATLALFFCKIGTIVCARFMPIPR